MQIVITGHEGMLGTYVKKVLKDYDLILPDKGYNDFKGKIVVNCAGIIRGRDESQMEEVNTFLPRKISKQTKKLIQISTDCVFDGKRGFYQVYKDRENPNDYYGSTKLRGECGVIIRTSILGESKKGRGLLEWVRKQKEIDGYYTHLWNGITCLQLAYYIKSMIIAGDFTPSVRHLCSNRVYSKYELCEMIIDIYNLDVKIKRVWKWPKNMTLDGLIIGENLHDELLKQKEFEDLP